jgi:hypothetical protein
MQQQLLIQNCIYSIPRMGMRQPELQHRLQWFGRAGSSQSNACSRIGFQALPGVWFRSLFLNLHWLFVSVYDLFILIITRCLVDLHLIDQL